MIAPFLCSKLLKDFEANEADGLNLYNGLTLAFKSYYPFSKKIIFFFNLYKK